MIKKIRAPRSTGNNLSTVRARKTPDIQAFMCRMAEARHRDGVR